MNRNFIIFSVGKLLEILAFILLIPATIAFFEIKSTSFITAILDYRLIGFVVAIITAFLMVSFENEVLPTMRQPNILK